MTWDRLDSFLWWLVIRLVLMLVGVVLVLSITGLAKKKWGAHRHQQERYGDKHALLAEYLHNQQIMVAAGKAGIFGNRARRALLSKLPDFEEGHVDVVLSKLYASRPVRKAISSYTHKEAGVARADHEKRMLEFHERVEAAHAKALAAREASRA